MSNYDLNDYSRQMEGFRAADQARENLVNVSGADMVDTLGAYLPAQELAEKFSGLLRKHEELESDYQSERDNRRNYQRTVDQAHRAVTEYERQIVSRILIFCFV